MAGPDTLLHNAAQTLGGDELSYGAVSAERATLHRDMADAEVLGKPTDDLSARLAELEATNPAAAAALRDAAMAEATLEY